VETTHTSLWIGQVHMSNEVREKPNIKQYIKII
jgi:hypothetical protein